MSIKEQIRAEIERRKKENMYVDLPMSIGRYYEDRDILAFLDTLPEQTVELEEEAEEWAENEAYGKPDAEFEMAYKGFIAGAEWGRKQVLQEIYNGEVKPVDKITAAWLDDESNAKEDK